MTSAALYRSVAVIGAGAWGTALASAAARAGRDVMLYARDPAQAQAIQAAHENKRLPGMTIDAAIDITGDIERAARADIVLLAAPAQATRAAAIVLMPHLREGTPVVACAKGIERGSHQFMTEVIAE